MSNDCKNVSSRPTDLFCRFCSDDAACSPSPAPTTQLFSQSLSSHTPCSCLKSLSTTNNLCCIWRNKLQHVSNYAFWSWDDIFTQNWNCSSHSILCKCTKSPFTMSTKTSIEWNLFLSWSNEHETTYRLKLNVRGFFQRRNKTSDTDKHIVFFSPLVFLKSMWIQWKEFLSTGLICRLLNVW